MKPARNAVPEATEAGPPRLAPSAVPADRPPGALTASDAMNLYCRTCRRALNTRTLLGEISFYHPAELRGEACDHAPDPVPLTEVPDPVMVCDFCSTADPTWIFVCGDQLTEFRVVTTRTVGLGDYHQRHAAARVRRTGTAPGLTTSWGERWVACQACASCIGARDLYGLIGRVVETLPVKLTRGRRLAATRGRLHATFSTVFDTLLPGRGRITPEAPLGVWEEDPPASVSGPEPERP